MKPGRRGQLAVGLLVVLLGLAVLLGSWGLPVQAGYAGVGPGALPRVVGIVLLLLGVLLTREAWTSGFLGVDEEGERALGFYWPGFLWVSSGLIAYGLLVETAGFIVASTVLFVLVARGFGSARLLRDLIAGLLLSIGVYLIFSVGLNIQLPTGPFTFLRP